MAQVAIIKNDNSVTVDGIGCHGIDLSAINSNVHAIQYNTTTNTGHIEYVDATDNLIITSIAAYQSYIDTHTSTVAAEDAAEAEAATAQTNLEATYGYKRKMAHADMGDQLDQMYHDAVNGTTTWKDAVAAVKSAHPK